MSELSSGTVTFLFTDVERSTQLWDQFPAAMRAALERHDLLATELVDRHNGLNVKPRGEGDSLFLTFASAIDAARCAVAIQQALRAEAWPDDTTIKVRMALHTGEASIRDEDYYGSAVNRCARIRATGHGGQILLSQTTAEIVRDHLGEDVRLEPLGSHRLKDLQRPESLWQLRHEQWRETFPPPRSLETFKHNLPRQLTSFVGREQDIQHVKSLLDPAAPEGKTTSLLTLTGSGGSGKTRLALQVVAELVDAYEDGAWLTELAALPADAPPHAIAKAIADALRVKEQPGQDSFATLIEFLRPKSLLLLLDNCEHLEKGCVQAIHALLLACPHLRILATSRHQLSLPGETALRIPSLPFPGKQEKIALGEAMQYESVALFVERATAALTSFQLNVGNLPYVIEICRRLDGIPLALELAAARVSSMGVKQIAERLDHAFRFLKLDNAILERHRTIRAVIEWSYDRLEESEKTLLRRLAVFVGGWTLEACESVCAHADIDHWEVVDLLSRLVKTSLVTMQTVREDTQGTDKSKARPPASANAALGARPAESEPATRYFLLETLRQFGEEKLQAFGEAETARNQHLRYYLDLAEQTEPELIGPNQAHCLHSLEAEHDNFRTALKWATDDETRLRLAGALSRFWHMRGYVSEGRGWLTGGLARRRNVGPRTLAKALREQGFLAKAQGEYAQAIVALQESLALWSSLNNRAGMADAINSLGNVAQEQGDLAQARQHHESCLQIRRELNDAWGTATSLNNLGNVARIEGQLAQARAYYEQALLLYQTLGDATHNAVMRSNLGDIAFMEKNYADAKTLFVASLPTFRQQGNKLLVAILLYNLGQTVCYTEGAAAAAPLLAESVRLQLELDYQSMLAQSLHLLAQIATDQQQYPQAVRLLSLSELARSQMSAPFSDADHQDTEQQVARLRAALSAAEFQCEWQTAREQPFAQAILTGLV